LKTQWAGLCKECGNHWKVGDDIFYQKSPQAKCSDEECYKAQGGKDFVPNQNQDTTTGEQTKLNPLEDKMGRAGALDAQLANITYNRLKDVESKFGEIPVSEKLIFLESWARTLSMSIR